MNGQIENRWLLLIHQIPPRPNYFRVKVGRRLARIGAVAIKNSVYVMPKTEQTQEDFQWILREIVADGGEATLCEATLLDGLRDDQVQELFQAARDSDYAEIAEEAKRIADALPEGEIELERRAGVEGDVGRLKRKLAEIAAIDFFGASAKGTTEGLLSSIEARLHAGPNGSSDPGPSAGQGHLGRTWVTRTGVHIDRIASAWLIRRFVDRDAQFKFVSHKVYAPAPGELRFDMFEAEFTHEGDHCTFEVLLKRTGPHDPALRPLAEIIHDIDPKDGKFCRPETAGIASLIAGVAMAHREDEERLARGFALFDDLLEFFRRKNG